jgi:hypothetical protein
VTLVGFSAGGGDVARYLSRQSADCIARTVQKLPTLLEHPRTASVFSYIKERYQAP